MNYGTIRVGRCLAALVLTVGAYFVWSSWWLLLVLPWFLGSAYRVYDLRVVGLGRVDKSVMMGRWTWAFDFALRGYLRSGEKEPIVH